jgi:hypothetical protein
MKLNTPRISPVRGARQQSFNPSLHRTCSVLPLTFWLSLNSLHGRRSQQLCHLSLIVQHSCLDASAFLYVVGPMVLASKLLIVGAFQLVRDGMHRKFGLL